MRESRENLYQAQEPQKDQTTKKGKEISLKDLDFKEEDLSYEEAEELIDLADIAFEEKKFPATNKEPKILKEKLLSHPFLKKYFKQKIKPENFNLIIEAFEERMQEIKNREEAREYLEILKNIVKDINSCIENYYISIQRIKKIHKVQKFRMTREEYAYQIEKIDRLRRLYHNSLVNNLKMLNRAIKKLLPEKLGLSLPQEYLFSESDLENKDLISDWAYNIAVGKRLFALYNKIEEILKQDK